MMLALSTLTDRDVQWSEYLPKIAYDPAPNTTKTCRDRFQASVAAKNIFRTQTPLLLPSSTFVTPEVLAAGHNPDGALAALCAAHLIAIGNPDTRSNIDATIVRAKNWFIGLLAKINAAPAQYKDELKQLGDQLAGFETPEFQSPLGAQGYAYYHADYLVARASASHPIALKPMPGSSEEKSVERGQEGPADYLSGHLAYPEAEMSLIRSLRHMDILPTYGLSFTPPSLLLCLMFGFWVGDVLKEAKYRDHHIQYQVHVVTSTGGVEYMLDSWHCRGPPPARAQPKSVILVGVAQTPNGFWQPLRIPSADVRAHMLERGLGWKVHCIEGLPVRDRPYEWTTGSIM